MTRGEIDEKFVRRDSGGWFADVHVTSVMLLEADVEKISSEHSGANWQEYQVALTALFGEFGSLYFNVCSISAN